MELQVDCRTVCSGHDPLLYPGGPACRDGGGQECGDCGGGLLLHSRVPRLGPGHHRQQRDHHVEAGGPGPAGGHRQGEARPQHEHHLPQEDQHGHESDPLQHLPEGGGR